MRGDTTAIDCACGASIDRGPDIVASGWVWAGVGTDACYYCPDCWPAPVGDGVHPDEAQRVLDSLQADKDARIAELEAKLATATRGVADMLNERDRARNDLDAAIKRVETAKVYELAVLDDYEECSQQRDELRAALDEMTEWRDLWRAAALARGCAGVGPVFQRKPTPTKKDDPTC